MPSKFPGALDALPTDAQNQTDAESGKANAKAYEAGGGTNPTGEGEHAKRHNEANGAINAMQDWLLFGGGQPPLLARVVRMLEDGLEDVVGSIVGDSTSAIFGSTWVGPWLEALGKRFPEVTIKYQDWNHEKGEPNAVSEKQKGTGPRTLWIYNSAVSGVSANYQMVNPVLETMIASKQPDFIIFSHGHNQGSTPATLVYYRDNMVIATQTLQRACPKAEIVMFAQNGRRAPATAESIEAQARRQPIVEEIARNCGYGFLNVHRLFEDTDPSLVSLVVDGVHPTPAGYALIANALLKRMVSTHHLGSQQRSSFTVPAVQLLTNGDFSSLPEFPKIANWSTTNVTPEKDLVNYESDKGYSLKIKTTAAGNSFITNNINGAALKKLHGEWVTYIARIWVPAGQDAHPGVVSISQTAGNPSVASDTLTFEGKGVGQGGWRWSMVTARIARSATGVNFNIRAHQSATGEVSIDRAIAVLGLWPRDIR